MSDFFVVFFLVPVAVGGVYGVVMSLIARKGRAA